MGGGLKGEVRKLEEVITYKHIYSRAHAHTHTHIHTQSFCKVNKLNKMHCMGFQIGHHDLLNIKYILSPIFAFVFHVTRI